MIHHLAVYQADVHLIMEWLLDLMQACNGTPTRSPMHCPTYAFLNANKVISGIKVLLFELFPILLDTY